MSVTAIVLHTQPHQFLYGALNSLLSQSIPISKIIALNSTGKAINKDIPNGAQVTIVGKEPSANYIQDVNLVLPKIETEFLMVVESKNLFYKNMVSELQKKILVNDQIAGVYSDFDLFNLSNNQSVRGFLPSYDARFLERGFMPPANTLLRVSCLKAVYPIDSFLKIAQKYLFLHVPESLYMERSFGN